MPDLPSVFNVAAIGASVVGSLGVAWLVAKFASPVKMIKPDSKTAYIVTGFKGLFPKKAQFVVRSEPQAVWKFGMSEPEAVDLKSFTVNVKRMGIHKATDVEDRIKDTFVNDKDESLTLGDKIKAEVDVDFYVQVETEDTVTKDIYGPDIKDAEGNVTKKGELIEKGKPVTGEQNIINAKRTLGEINKDTIEKYLLPKADSALRAAAAQMTIDEIQKDREAFLDRVKANFSLHGLKVTDAALREFKQAPKESFNPNDYFDAQGLRLVTEKANESLKAVNDSNQMTQTLIARKTQEQVIERLTIEQDQKKADLAQKQKIAEMEAQQKKQIAEISAENDKLAKIAAIVADQATQEREIEKARQIGVANAQKDQQTKVANEQSEQKAAEARIVKEQAVELANRAKEIALQNKAAEVAAAEQATNIKKADAVTAEQGVITARETAEAERQKKIAVINAEKTAQESAAGQKIAAEVQVYVAEQGALAKKKEGEGITTLATATAEAAKITAAGAYETTFQPLKAAADGKVADASAERALNEARNLLSDANRAFQVDLKRVEITPDVVQSLVSAYAAIDNFNVTSISGAPGSGSGAGGIAVDGGTSGASNVFDQFYASSRDNAIKATLLKKIITDLGGDPKIADNLPGLNGAASAAPVVTVPAAAPAPAAT